MSELFISYPRTFHLFGSKVASGDKMLSARETDELLARKDVTFYWESKLDGSNVAISVVDGIAKAQNRSHFLDQRVHPQYFLLKNWVSTFGDVLKDVLSDRYVMFGEWCYAVHTIKYSSLKHYFNEFDIWDRETSKFLGTPERKAKIGWLEEMGVLAQVPVVHVGNININQARKMMDHKPYYGEDKPEGLYVKVEKDGEVIERYKLVRDEFIQSIIDGGDHWASKPIEVQKLAEGVDIFNV